MPARNARFRGLNEDFRHFLDQRSAWPLVKQFPMALKAKGGGRKADYFRMKEGAVVPEKYVLALIELLRGKPALADFLSGKGIDPAGLGVEQIVGEIAGPLQSEAAPLPDDDADWHMRGVEGLIGLFTDYIWGKLIRPGTLCVHEADVKTAVDMIMAYVGRISSGDMSLPPFEAIRSAERHMRLGRGEYLARALDLWSAERWSIAFAVVDRQRVGCSMVLPLSETAYDQLYRGERNSHAMTGADLALPCRTFLLEAISHRHDAEYPDMHMKSSQCVRTTYLQLAVMSLDGPGPLRDDQPFRVLSIAGNPTNAKRLKRSGFDPTGTKMPGFDLDLMEMNEKKAWWTPVIVKKLQERLLAAGEDY